MEIKYLCLLISSKNIISFNYDNSPVSRNFVVVKGEVELFTPSFI